MSRDAMTILQKLPPIAFIDNRPGDDGERRVPDAEANVIGIRRGEPGYFPIKSPHSADWHNTLEGVTPAQREAMFAGSVFGWAVPAADVDNYTADGKLLPPRRAAS
jgi:hypothetical protein